jgi:predicted phage terminase large subunit-like protein
MVDDNGTRRALGMSRVILSVDAAFRDTATSDYVVMRAWGKRGAGAYLFDRIRARMGFSETLRRFEMFAARWPQASKKLIQAKANGDAIIDSLRKRIPGLVPVEPHESKVARVEAISSYVEAGNVVLPSSSLCPWVGDLVEEAAAFPSGAHDD